MNENINQMNATYLEFWNWFEKNEKDFFNEVKSHEKIEEKFLDIVLPKLQEINENFYILTGMCDDSTAELIVTVDGNIKQIVYAEDFINTAPRLENWKFTALKPETDIENVNIKMGDFHFNKDNIFFYSEEDPTYPDEIILKLVHVDLNEENANEISNGTYIFIDNYLGELNFATQIDSFEIIGQSEAEKELVPIWKLKDFLSWREREFTEKYAGTKVTIEDSHSLLEGTLHNDLPIIAVLNTDLLKWDLKASHPWLSVLRIEFDGENTNGLPDTEDYEKMNEIEDGLISQLTSEEGHVNIGRQTAENIREIYFASKDFRKVSKILDETIKEFSAYKMSSEIYKDKYWQSFEHFGIN